MTNILAIMANTSYSSGISELIQDSANSSGKTLFVSLNKTYKSLVRDIEDEGIDSGKFIFIDTITATLVNPEPRENVIFVSSPDDIKTLYSKIIRAAKHSGIELVLFDSLSSLTTYNDFDAVLRFVSTLLGSLSLLGCPALFTCLKSDEETALIKQVKMKVDKTMELGGKN